MAGFMFVLCVLFLFFSIILGKFRMSVIQS